MFIHKEERKTVEELKRWKSEEAKKMSKVFVTFFEKPITSSLKYSMVSLEPDTNLLNVESKRKLKKKNRL